MIFLFALAFLIFLVLLLLLKSLININATLEEINKKLNK